MIISRPWWCNTLAFQSFSSFYLCTYGSSINGQMAKKMSKLTRIAFFPFQTICAIDAIWCEISRHVLIEQEFIGSEIHLEKKKENLWRR